MNELKNVDGANSGLDADLLDGKQASEFAMQADMDDALKCLTENPVNDYTLWDIPVGAFRITGNHPGLPSGVNTWGLSFVLPAKQEDPKNDYKVHIYIAVAKESKGIDFCIRFGSSQKWNNWCKLTIPQIT